MASTPRSYGQQRTKNVMIRVSESEHAALKAQAAAAEMSMADYVRSCALEGSDLAYAKSVSNAAAALQSSIEVAQNFLRGKEK